MADAKTKSDRKLEDKEDLTQVRHPLAKNVHRILFETEVPKKVDNFLEGRMAYVFELDDEYAESDIPTTLMRSKAGYEIVIRIRALECKNIVIILIPYPVHRQTVLICRTI